jgi:hypothetical protein
MLRPEMPDDLRSDAVPGVIDPGVAAPAAKGKPEEYESRCRSGGYELFVR